MLKTVLDSIIKITIFNQNSSILMQRFINFNTNRYRRANHVPIVRRLPRLEGLPRLRGRAVAHRVRQQLAHSM